jgi:hypothetical protein
VETLFASAVFVGRADWDRMHEAGDRVFHCAAYFGPLLAHYQGMRREEFCGLAVQDIIVDNGPRPSRDRTWSSAARRR